MIDDTRPMPFRRVGKKKAHRVRWAAPGGVLNADPLPESSGLNYSAYHTAAAVTKPWRE